MGSWLEKLDEWVNRHRPRALLGVVALTIGVVALLNWATGSDLYRQIFYPKRETIADVRFWSALVYGLAFTTGLPVAFLLWHWRDRNVRDQIENARNDTNLKEFQDVQLRAAGGTDKDYSDSAKSTLQVAALHQLTGFLNGDYGRNFVRPAFETIRASLEVSASNRSVSRIESRFGMNNHAIARRLAKYPKSALKARIFASNFRRKIILANLPEIDMALQRIIQQNWDRLILISKKSNRINFSGFSISKKKIFVTHESRLVFAFSRVFECDFGDSHLISTNFIGAVLVRCVAYYANLSSSNLIGAHIQECEFHESDFSYSKMLGAGINGDFRRCNFSGCDLTGCSLTGKFDAVDFSNAVLRNASFWGAEIGKAKLDGTDVRGATMPKMSPETVASCKNMLFDSSTTFWLPTDEKTFSRTPEDINEIHEMWRQHGARHVDDEEIDDGHSTSAL